MSDGGRQREIDWAAWLNRVAWGVLLGLLALNFLAVVAHAVNVPHWDDWSALDPGALERTPRWGWILGFHNVHRTVWTNLSIWILYRLDGWNLKAHLVLNFAVFAVFAVGYLRTLETWFSAPLGLPGLFLVTAIPDEVHLHATNGQWTFALAFTFLGIVFALRADRWAWLSPLWGVCAIFSMGTGLVAAVGLLVLHGVLAWQWPEQRRRHAVSAAFLVAAMGIWAIGFPGSDSQVLGPGSAQLWTHYFTLVAGGFGYVSRPLPALGGVAVLLLLALAGLRAATLGSSEPVDRRRWLALLAWVGGLLLALASVSRARAWAGDGGALSGRYLFVALFLAPPFWLLLRWGVLARIQPEGLRRAASALALVVLLLPLRSAFDFGRIYDPVEESRLRGVRCLRRMARAGLAPVCPDIQYDLELAPTHHRRAVSLRLSYLGEQLDR